MDAYVLRSIIFILVCILIIVIIILLCRIKRFIYRPGTGTIATFSITFKYDYIMDDSYLGPNSNSKLCIEELERKRGIRNIKFARCINCVQSKKYGRDDYDEYTYYVEYWLEPEKAKKR